MVPRIMAYFYEKRSDEGSNSTFVARMFMGVLELRDLIIMSNNDPRNRQVDQNKFDQLYEPIRNSLEIALGDARSLKKLSSELIKSGRAGKLIKFYDNGGYELSNTKESQIQSGFTSVINHSSIAIKTHLQSFLKEICDFDIGFLFQKENLFKKQLDEFTLISLHNYFKASRIWSENYLGFGININTEIGGCPSFI